MEEKSFYHEFKVKEQLFFSSGDTNVDTLSWELSIKCEQIEYMMNKRGDYAFKNEHPSVKTN